MPDPATRDVEIVADYRQHTVGEREIVDWTRKDGQTYRNMPVVYIREVTQADYLAHHPDVVAADLVHCHRRHFFWEVSVD